MKDDEKRGETPRFFLRFFPRKYKYLAWIYDKDSLIAFIRCYS